MLSLYFTEMASGARGYFYECNVTLKHALVTLVKDKDLENEMCRAIAALLQTMLNLQPVRRMTSSSVDILVASVVFHSDRDMSPALVADVNSLIKTYFRGWVEGVGAALSENFYDLWLNCAQVHFFSIAL